MATRATAIFHGRVCAFPLLSEQVAPQAAERTALMAVDQAAHGLVECHLADLDQDVPRAGACQEREAGIEAGHGPPPRRAVRKISARGMANRGPNSKPAGALALAALFRSAKTSPTASSPLIQTRKLRTRLGG